MTATPNPMRCSERLRLSRPVRQTTAAFPPTMQVPRRTPQSLSLGSLGVAEHFSQ